MVVDPGPDYPDTDLTQLEKSDPDPDVKNPDAGATIKNSYPDPIHFVIGI